MNPHDPSSFNHRVERLSTGRTYHFVDQTPENDDINVPTLLLVHGFPDSWYGWRYQIAPWVKKGWRVVAPDTLGYGGTDKPSDVSAYSSKLICKDLVALLDFIEGGPDSGLFVEKAVVVGHDWGAEIAWRMYLWHPERVITVVTLSIPFHPPAPSYIPQSIGAKRVPGLGYQVYLEDPRSTNEIESNLRTFLDVLYRNDSQARYWTGVGQLEKLVRGEVELPDGPSALSPSEMAFYVKQFEGSMTGPLMYYKTKRIRFNDEKEAKLPSFLPTDVPFLLIRGTEDPASPKQAAKRSKIFVKSLNTIDLEGAGHWLMVERKEEVTRYVGDWVESVLRELRDHKPKIKL